MKRYFQYYQDFLIDFLFKKKRNGIFLDIGANDGISFSNTYRFEKFRNWTGICIEPHPEIFEKLKRYTQLLISHHKSNIILKGNLIISLSQMFIITVMFFMKASILHIVACYMATFCLSYIYWYHYGSRLIGIRWTHIVKDIFPYLITTLFSVFVSMLILFHVKNLYIVFTGKILLFVGIYLIVLYIFDSKMLKDSIVLLKHKTVN
ncbi:MAG: FkbM family methyltransferase [Bacteroidales bacterium]|jgi:hypothetical protein|nr:FkbM family methyltransferase [Bacteroidales bacterium]